MRRIFFCFLALGFGSEIEQALDLIYQRLDMIFSCKRRYKSLKFVEISAFDKVFYRITFEL